MTELEVNCEVFTAISSLSEKSWLLLEVADDSGTDATLSVDKFGDKEASYQTLLDALPEDECRYCLVRIRNQICLVNWSPDAATTRSRLLFHASLESVKLRLGNVVQLVVEVADEVDQMTEDALLENAEKA
eukprot:TRINITY_DN2959_c0_g1_i1.p1 TRINITY_DN2959_c0_g1~~TRINITY_DN2959_c0_g1_i1.p1  ORF type:complete len:131 (+),score=28.07 TRINITY_DN2959_c0_g1_i1:357-749(+)